MAYFAAGALFVAFWIEGSSLEGAIGLFAVALAVGVVLGRTSGAPANWPNLLARAGRLLRAGVLAGALSALLMPVHLHRAYAGIGSGIGQVPVHRVVHETLQALGFSVLFGAIIALCAIVPATLGASLRRRTRAGSTHALPSGSAGVSVLLTLLTLLLTVAGFEAILDNDDIVSGCSSACIAYPMALGSRVFGAVLFVAAVLGASAMCRRAQTRRGGRALAGGMIACVGIALVSLGATYTAVASSMEPGVFHVSWLGLRVGRWELGDRLGAGPWQIDRRDELALHVKSSLSEP